MTHGNLHPAKIFRKDVTYLNLNGYTKRNLHKDASLDRFKARFVACGYSQVHGLDYTRSFFATVRAASFRFLVVLAAGTEQR